MVLSDLQAQLDQILPTAQTSSLVSLFHEFFRSPRKFFLASNFDPSCYSLGRFWFALAPKAAGREPGGFCWIQLPSTFTSFLQSAYLPLLGEDLLIIQPAFSPDIAEGGV